MAYTCLSTSIDEASNTSTLVEYGGDNSLLGIFNPAPSPGELAAYDEFKFQYRVTAGPNGAVVRIKSVTFTFTYTLSVSEGTTQGEAFLVQMTGLTGAAIAPGVYVIVGVQGRIFYSTDRGQNWNVATSPEMCDYRDVVYDGSNFYAIGTGGVIVSSPDGINWVTKRKDTNSDFVDAAVGREKVVVAQATNNVLVAKNRSSNNFDFIGAEA